MKAKYIRALLSCLILVSVTTLSAYSETSNDKTITTYVDWAVQIENSTGQSIVLLPMEGAKLHNPGETGVYFAASLSGLSEQLYWEPRLLKTVVDALEEVQGTLQFAPPQATSLSRIVAPEYFDVLIGTARPNVGAIAICISDKESILFYFDEQDLSKMISGMRQALAYANQL